MSTTDAAERRRRGHRGPDPVAVSRPDQQPGPAGSRDRQRAPATVRHDGGLRRGHSGRTEGRPGGGAHRGPARGPAPATRRPPRGQAPPGRHGQRPAPPRTGILGRAKTVLRDAAMAAGMLIILLLASLIGIRVRRRRAERGTLPAPEPRTLLNAPSGPAGDLGRGRPAYGRRPRQRAAAAHMAAPGTTPWRTGPGAQDRRSYARATGQAAPVWTPNRPVAARDAAPPPPAGRRRASCPYPGHPLSRALRHPDLRAAPANPVLRRERESRKRSASRHHVPGGTLRRSAARRRTRRRARNRGRSGRYRTSSPDQRTRPAGPA